MSLRNLFRSVAAAVVYLSAGSSTAASLDPGLEALPATATERAILTFASAPSGTVTAQLQALGLQVSTPFSRLPMLVVDGPVAALAALESFPGLRSVYLDRPQQALLDLTEPKVTGNGAAYTENCGGAACDGAGVAVAVIDTGVDGTHPDLCLDGNAFTPAMPVDALCPGQTPVMLQNVEVLTDNPSLPVVVEGIANTDTTGGHGTHVASIVAGQGVASARFTGTAPGARLVGVSAGDALTVLNTTVAIEWVIDNKDRFGIRVINNSWGAPAGSAYDPAHPVVVASSAAADAGLTVVFSAGNSGPGTATMNMYSVNPDVLSVAAGGVSPSTPQNILPRDPIEEPADFSAVGVPGSALWHPDIMAPGMFVIAARASTGFAGAGDAAFDVLFMQNPNELQHYTTHSGTSMAAPHVSGIAAMVWQATLSTGATPSAETVREILLNSANPFQDGTPSTLWQEYRAGRGYLDGHAAVREALFNLAAYADGVNDAPGPAIATDVTSFGGSLGAAGGSCPATLGSEQVLVPRHEFEVFAGALTMDVMLDWEVAANDLELCLYDPSGALTSGRRVESDTISAAVDREHIFTPAAGLWTVEVRGQAAVEPFEGYTSVLYPASTPPQPVTMLDLSPPVAFRDTGSVHLLTATVSNDDGPVAGAPVSWSVDGVGVLLLTDEVTGADGTATAQLTSAQAGTSTVTASSDAFSDTATVIWTDPGGGVGGPGDCEQSNANDGRAWGSGHLVTGEHLNLNVHREGSAAPWGHLKFDGNGRFRASHVVALCVSAQVADLEVEGSWQDEPGFRAKLRIEDQGNPGKTVDSFAIEVRAADDSVVDGAVGVISAGNLKVRD